MSGQLRYKVQIFGAGVTSTTGAVAFTVLSTQIAGVPQMGGQRAEPLRGQVTSLPWNVDIADINSFFTAQIASTGGQLQLLGRLARILASTNSTASSAYGALQVGRITDLALGNPNVATWKVTLQDERVIERNTQIFTRVQYSNAVSLIPAGPISPFPGTPGFVPGTWTVMNRVGNLVCLLYRDPSERFPTSTRVQQAILSDMNGIGQPNNTNATHGNFFYLRFRNILTLQEYEIAQFDTGFASGFPLPLPYVNSIAQVLVDGPPQPPFYVWLVWPTSPPSVGSSLLGFLYMPNRPPDAYLPLLLGGPGGFQPFTLLKAIYDGTYSTTFTVRYSTAAMAARISTQYGTGWWRITSPQNMASFVEQQIYQPNFCVPAIDLQGRVTPVSLDLPTTATINPATLLTLGSSNLSVHPTFEQPSNQAVTRVSGRVPVFQSVAWYGILNNGNNDLNPDLLSASTFTITASTVRGTSGLQSTNAKTFIGQELALTVPNYGSPLGYVTAPGQTPPLAPFLGLSPYLMHRAQNIFARFANGPLWARNVKALALADATTRGKVVPGQYVILSLGTYPMPQNRARGGSRIMQVLTRQETPTGPQFELLDAGPNLAATSAPTIAVAASTISSRHGLKLTMTHVALGATYTAQIAPTSSTGATVPGTGSSQWRTISVGRGSTGTVIQVGSLPSHTKFFGRAKAQYHAYPAFGTRLPSPWSSAAGAVVTAKIPGPTSLKTTGITKATAIFKWKNGSSQYPIDVMLAPTTTVTLGTSRRVATLLPLSTRYDAQLGSSQSKYTWGVRYADAYGGFSTMPTQSGTATTVAPTASAMTGRGILLVQGGT